MRALLLGVFVCVPLGLASCGGDDDSGSDAPLPDVAGDVTADTGDGGPDGECTPDCTERVCGDDGCGGSCGTCGAGEFCTPGGQCADEGTLVCEHVEGPEDQECTVTDDPCQCVGCVDDGECTLDDDCVCADCVGNEFCSDPASCIDDGVCSPFNESCVCDDCAQHPECEDCVPQCGDRVCGSDGCGGTCGDCGAGEFCTPSGQCADEGALVCERVNVPSDQACTVTDDPCQCVGCVDDGECTLDDDCICQDCADTQACVDPSVCIDDGVCSPFNESCVCDDCAQHPECQ